MPNRLTKFVLVGSFVVLVVLLSTSLFTIHRAMILRDTMTKLTEGTVVHTRLSGDFNVHAHRVIIEAQSIMLTRVASEGDEIHKAFTDTQDIFQQLEQFHPPDFGDASLASDYQDLDSQRQELLGMLEHMVDSVGEPGVSDASETIYELIENSEDLLDHVNKQSEATLIREQARAGDLSEKTMFQLLASIMIGMVLMLGVALTVFLILRKFVVNPLVLLTAALQQFADGQAASIRVTSRTEIGQLQRAFNHMSQVISHQQVDLREQVDLAEQARLRAEQSQQHLSEQITVVEQQRELIREMSVPVLPVSDSILVMPLVGALDTKRLRDLQRQALAAIKQQHATKLLLDITGIPLIDTQVGQGLIKIIQAGRVLGADVVLIGVRPEVAQAIVALGVDLPLVHTARDLRTVLQL